MATVNVLTDLGAGDHEVHAYEDADFYIDDNQALNITKGKGVVAYYPHGHYIYINTT